MLDTSLLGVVNVVDLIFTEVDAVPKFISPVVEAKTFWILDGVLDTMVLGTFNDPANIL